MKSHQEINNYYPGKGFVLCLFTGTTFCLFLALSIYKPCDFAVAQPDDKDNSELVKLREEGYAIPESFIKAKKRYEK